MPAMPARCTSIVINVPCAIFDHQRRAQVSSCTSVTSEIVSGKQLRVQHCNYTLEVVAASYGSLLTSDRQTLNNGKRRTCVCDLPHDQACLSQKAVIMFNRALRPIERPQHVHIQQTRAKCSVSGIALKDILQAADFVLMPCIA